MSARVLLIEDDDILRNSLSDNLAAQGWEVRAESDGVAALETALTWRTDVILLDVMLPGINGYEICKSLRLEGIETPILMITARGQTEDIVLGLELGADDYVVKPFALAELLARVRRLLKRGGNQQKTYDLGEGLTLNLEALRIEGLEAELAPKEFGVLAFLRRNEGRALTRAMILREVWGPGLFVTERSVDRAVRVLRARLGKVGKHIETVRGVGYRWQ